MIVSNSNEKAKKKTFFHSLFCFSLDITSYFWEIVVGMLKTDDTGFCHWCTNFTKRSYSLLLPAIYLLFFFFFFFSIIQIKEWQKEDATSCYYKIWQFEGQIHIFGNTIWLKVLWKLITNISPPRFLLCDKNWLENQKTRRQAVTFLWKATRMDARLGACELQWRRASG